MEIKLKSKKLKLFALVLLIIILSSAVSLVFFIKKPYSEAATDPLAEARANSQFSFNGATGWWQGATNQTSMALFNYNKADKTGTCFTSVEYTPGIVDEAAELQKIDSQLTKLGGGYVVNQLGTKNLDLQTTSGPRQYELHQSEVITPRGGEKLKGGQEFGYVQLPKGYIKIMGYCDTAKELPDTLPALKAIKYNPDS